LLALTRLGGGGLSYTRLEPSWESYEVLLPLGYGTDALIFSLAGSPDAQSPTETQEGVFLLDDVKAFPIANLATNGNFDTDITPNTAFTEPPGASAPVVSPEMALRSSDTWNGDGGSLQVSVSDPDGYRNYTHNSGAAIFLSSVVPAGAWLEVAFLAKSLSGGSNVSVIKTWGGSTFGRARIEPTWQPYHVYTKLGQDTSAVFFNLVPQDNGYTQPCETGVFLLDEISVAVVSGPRDPARCGPHGVEPCRPSCSNTGDCGEAALDHVSQQPLGAYSVSERLRSAYAGPALRVRRVNDLAERSIGFVSPNALDEGAIASFCGKTDCDLAGLYDQSGRGNDVGETASALIKLYDGASQSVIHTDSKPILHIHDEAVNVNRPDSIGLVGNPAMTVAYVGRYVVKGPIGLEVTPVRIGATHAGNPGDEIALGYQPDTDYIYVGGGGANWSTPGNTVVHTTVLTHAAGANVGDSLLRYNGVPVPELTGSNFPFNLGNRNLLIGKDASNQSGATVELRSTAIWDSVLSEDDLKSVEAGLSATALRARRQAHRRGRARDGGRRSRGRAELGVSDARGRVRRSRAPGASEQRRSLSERLRRGEPPRRVQDAVHDARHLLRLDPRLCARRRGRRFRSRRARRRRGHHRDEREQSGVLSGLRLDAPHGLRTDCRAHDREPRRPRARRVDGRGRVHSRRDHPEQRSELRSRRRPGLRAPELHREVLERVR
jgi:hypothetical protein